MSRQDEAKEPAARQIRDKAFADRLVDAVESSKHAPNGHGRQKWLRGKLRDDFAVEASAEALRKWFAGETRPRPKTVKLIARILEVDEAWLSLGLKPDELPHEARQRNANADGAVNFIAGLIQMNGGVIAFPDYQKDGTAPDLFAIIAGQQLSIEARRGMAASGRSVRFNLPATYVGRVVLGIVDTDDETRFAIVRFTQELIERHGERRGGFVEVTIKAAGDAFKIEEDLVPVISGFRSLAA